MAAIKSQCTVIGDLLDTPVYRPARNGRGARLTAVIINTPRRFDTNLQKWTPIPGAEPVRIIIQLDGKTADAIQRSIELDMLKVGTPVMVCGRVDDRPHVREYDGTLETSQVIHATSLNPDLVTMMTRRGC
ncbi:hypothetical protein [Bifidobacterium callitrichidarum]|uniref:Single-stranded DNA-binding protein n=1 Tax=Bifidobacterium callitrichidarum TaxID=2052941 RepID=A0A2U2NC88_9BIFI|nr:hypothetical protein [Bifidobacterium callitrichidarum]PWG66707.1 hypothetical protein DF196_02040 [Bifidobacterium callitrichidarum]